MKVVLLILVLLGALIQDSLSLGLAGGLSEERAATAEIQKLAEKMHEAVEQQLDRKLDIFQAVAYSSQVVAGTNYFIKVKVSAYEYVHIKVFVPLAFTGKEPELSNALDKKKETDPLLYFDSL